MTVTASESLVKVFRVFISFRCPLVWARPPLRAWLVRTSN
jgi:hypothetical protein